MKNPNPTPEDVGVQANMVFIKILPIRGKISFDHIGRFPVTTRSGRKYIIVLAYYNTDDILAEPLISRSETELLCVVKKLYEN